MARTTDVIDPEYRKELTEAESLLDEGDYNESVRRSADIYRRLVTVRPDLIIVRRTPELSAVAGRPERPRFQPWPDGLGVVLAFDDEKQPLMKFEKDDFMMSEAITYFEHTLDAAVRAQENPA